MVLAKCSWTKCVIISGGFRNSERGIQPLAREARPQILGLPRPLPVTLEVRTEYLEATLGLVKCLEISKELIRECVTMPGCCCCMPLLHNHLMDSCTVIIIYAKIHYSPPKGGAFAAPLPPLNPPLRFIAGMEVSQEIQFPNENLDSHGW